MIPEREVQERLYKNRVLLLEVERERLFRAASGPETRPNLLLRVMAFLGKGLIWLGTWLEAQYDRHALTTADHRC